MKARQFSFDDLIIKHDSPRLQYRRRRDDLKKAVHWGQRKLLLSEIEFFTLYWNPRTIPNPICVYAGAAPGNHIPFLSLLFPQFMFHLYDPSAFAIEESDRIKIFNEYFTDAVASEYSGRDDIFFISDIRTSGYVKQFETALKAAGITKFDKQGYPIGPSDIIKQIWADANAKHEDQIWGDMNMQQNWVLIMNPEHALLKMRLPYSPDGSNRNVEYLSGTVYWQVWPGPTSTETRLKPLRNKNGTYEKTIWSNLQYEEWAFYHNSVVREQMFYLNPFFNNRDPIDYPELLNDYDSSAEAFILARYSFSQCVIDILDVYQTVKMLSNSITSSLNRHIPAYNSLSLSKKRRYGRRPVNIDPLTCPLPQPLPFHTVAPRSPNRRDNTRPATGISTSDYVHTHVNIDPTWRQQSKKSG